LAEGALIAACQVEDAPYGLLVAGTRLRLLAAAAGEAGPTTRYLELDARTLEPCASRCCPGSDASSAAEPRRADATSPTRGFARTSGALRSHSSSERRVPASTAQIASGGASTAVVLAATVLALRRPPAPAVIGDAGGAP
jgi:hypothetical protein